MIFPFKTFAINSKFALKKEFPLISLMWFRFLSQSVVKKSGIDKTSQAAYQHSLVLLISFAVWEVLNSTSLTLKFKSFPYGDFYCLANVRYFFFDGDLKGLAEGYNPWEST